MSQEGGDTLSLQPSSASSQFDTPHQTAAMDAGTLEQQRQQPHVAAALVPHDHDNHTSSDDDEGTSGGKAEGKSRRELPPGAVATLKSWLLSPEHFTHPYPTPQDQIMLMHKTGIDKKQLKNWFTNARRRIWKPMLKKQLEAGKLAAVAAAGGTLATSAGGGGGLVVGVPQPDLSVSLQSYNQQSHQAEQAQAPQEEMYSNFQRAQMQGDAGGQQLRMEDEQYQQQQYQQQQQQQQVQYDQGNGQMQQKPMYDQYGNEVYDNGYQQQYHQQDGVNQQQPESFPLSNSIGSLAPINPSGSINSMYNMIKTDSHAVLMELFARDQDLVRQAAAGKSVAFQAAATAAHTEGASPQASGQSPYVGATRWSAMNPQSSSLGQKQNSVTFGAVPSLSSWPHFSSVSSLNNLGGLQGVKSITNLSAADLSSQGNLNKMGNLAQVKSIENMGRFDSFAFLEVFFDDKSGLASSALGNGQRGIKRERDDDDAIGLSLDGDDGTSPGQFNNNKAPAAESAQPQMPISGDGMRSADGDEIDGGTLKRAYDDALAARGLISVRRSSEKLTDLALPAKMQRTLSQEYIRQHNQGVPMADFFSTNNSAYAPNRITAFSQMQFQGQQQPTDASVTLGGVPIPDQSMTNTSVEVPSSTKCTLCSSVNVDTQLRPCGHMFHGRCLKPSLQNAIGPPKCPICSTPMQSAILAVPTAATDCGVLVV